MDGGELNENIPLQNPKRKTCFQYFFEGPRFITTSFGAFSLVVTIALFIQIYYGDFQVIPHGSVATDNKECSTIGTRILKEGGNAVDSAIASAFCLAVVNPHTCGLDAGGYMLIYNHRNRMDAKTIDFSEYKGSLPKLLLGLIKAHQYYGQLPWMQLVQPAMDLAMKGFFVSKQLELTIKAEKAQKIFGQIQAGNKLRLEPLANFLRTISELPDLYDQIKLVNVNTTDSRKAVFLDYNVYIPESVKIGENLVEGLSKIENLNFTSEDIGSIDYTYQLVNLSMDLYRKYRVEEYFNEGKFTNVAVMDLNDLYVSLVMGNSKPFGTRNMTETGYLPDVPSARQNTFLPIILVNRYFICAKRFALGMGNFGTALQIITRLAISTDNSTVTIEKPRFVISGNDGIGLEEYHTQAFSDAIVDHLNAIGNIIQIPEPYGSCNIVEKISDDLNSHSDSRGGGFASRF